MIYLHKILPLIASPFALFIFLIAWGVIKGKRKPIVLGLIPLLVCSTPVVANFTFGVLEAGYQRKLASDAETADAIVVLSGMTRVIDSPDGYIHEWGEGVDRAFAGIALYKHNRAPLIVFTRGTMPWSRGIPEGEHLLAVAVESGVPRSGITLTYAVANTEQEALGVAEILSAPDPSIILVTSAFHMARALMIFEDAGLKVQPFAVDFRTGVDGVTLIGFIPSSAAFTKFSAAIRELQGRAFYKLKLWLNS
jgi:uncharacterized SAM-binding protein YcdF (DUF218 family)